MSTKGRENWEKYKAGYVSTRLAEEVSTGNAGRDRWNELKKTIRFDKPESAQDVVSGSGAQAEKKSFLQRAGLTVSGGAKGSLAGNMDAMGVAYELGQSGRTQRYTEELREAQWAVARAKHDYDADPNNWQTKDALDTALTKMKGFADTLGKGAYEQALTAAYDAASKFETGDLKALYNGLGVVDPEQGTGVQQQAASAARDLAYGVQESASKDLQEAKEGASKFGQMLVDAGASMTQMGIDSAASGLMGFRPTKWNGGNKILQEALGIGEKVMTPGAMIPFATRAFGGSTMDARQDGADLKGQVLYGGAQAAKEVFTEKMFNIALPFAKAYGKGGLDSVVKNGIRKAAEKLGKSDVGRAALERVLKFGASAASEGLEEFVGDFFEWQMPRIYGGDTDSFGEMFSNALYDFAVGTISGAAGGAVEGGVDLYNDHAQAREAKKVYGDQAQEMVKKSLELNPDNDLAKKYQERLDNGKKLSGFQLNRLIEQNEADMATGDKAKIQSAAEARLTELGETGDVSRIAQAITKRTAGEALTRSEQKLIENSRYGRRVSSELNPENVEAGDYSTGWAERLGTDRINVEAYRKMLQEAENAPQSTPVAQQPADTATAEKTQQAQPEAQTGQIGTERVNRAAYNRGIQENGVTGAKYNAETGKLDAIVKDDQSKIKTVPAEKAELSPLQEELFDWAADLGEAGPVLVSAYRQPQNLETYARQFHNAYEYGKAGVPMDYVNRSQAVSYLNTTQREIAYEEGAKAHQRDLQSRQEKKRSGGIVDSTTQKKPSVSLRGATVGGVKYAPVNKKTMDGRQWASVGTMKAFAQATGVNVVFYESQANERGEYEGANGFYKDGTLYLDINAGRDRVAMGETAILKTAAHEITHYIKEDSPEQYEVLKNFVVEKLTREKGISFDDLVTDKQRREPGLSYEEAVDEVVADACEMMLKDSKAVEQLARENRSLAERIRQWIRKWVRSLKAAMEGLTADRPESRAMMQYAQELQEIWDNALVDAVRNGRGTVETDTRLQASPRKKYWRPDLTENEWRLLERRMRKEIGSRENILDEATKWVYANEKGVQVFALYGIGDGTDATPLYAVGGEKAATAADDMQKFVNGGYRYDKGTGTALSRIRGFLRTQGDGSGDIRETSRGRSAGADDALYGGERKGNAEKPAERSSENQRKVKEKFSMREPVEETRDLIALHNMTLDNLRGALKLGGLPMPSIAIVKAKSGHDQYGPISLVFRKDTIDPQLFRSNKVYGYDAWTPTAPRIEYEVNEKAADKLRELYYRTQREKGRDFAAPLYSVANTLEDELSNKGGLDKVVDTMRDDTRIMQIYLEDTGAGSVANVMRKNVSRMSESEIEMAQALTEKLGEKTIQSISAQTGESPFSARRRWFAKYGEAVNDALTAYYEQEGIPHEEALRAVEAETTANKIKSVLLARKYLNGNAEVITEEVDREATDKAIREKVNQDSYDQWLEGLFSGVVKNSGIYNGKDYYTASGDRRSFSATHYEVNLENTVRAMKQGDQTGVGTFFGGQAIWGVTAKDYKSIEEIKEDSGRLQKLSEEEYSQIRQQFTERLANITSEIMDKNNGNEFTASDDAASAIVETLRTKHTVKAIDKELRTYPTLRIQPDTAQKVFDLCRDISNMPTGYFEAKPQRAVGFDEAAAVVVPDNLPADLRKGLEQIGATVREYKAGDEQSRLEAVNADERVLFQQREPRLSDRAVLSIAAEMALRQQNKSWTPEDRNRLEIFTVRLRRMEEAQATLTALKEERKELLAGRKVSEITGEERTELTQNKNRIDIAKNKAERYEAAVWELESKEAIKTLLRKSREIVEKETAFKARMRYREKAEERQRYQVLKKRLERTTSEWKRMLLKPTKDRYAPEELVRSCLEVAMMLDESGPREGTKSRYRYETTSDALAYMKKQYDALADSEDQYYRLGYDKELSGLVEKLREALDGKAIRDLTYEEAGDVAQVLVSMQGILKDARYQIGSLERISTQKLVDSAVQQMQQMPERTKAEAATDAVARQSASVMRNIRRMCQYNDNAALYKLFRQMEEGVKKKDRFIMEANKLFDRFAGERMLKSATELKTYHISGVNMNMTEMEVMQLILSAKREQSDKTRHLEGKGFIVPDLKLMRKGKGQDAISKGQELNKTFLKDILQLEDGLDAWAKDYMHTASEFFNGMARNAINEATVQTKHRRMAVTKDYVPYEVDKRTVVKDIDGVKFDATIEGDGMLKSVVAGAQNPLIIRGLNTIVENHIERVGRIYGLAVPIRNFNKAYNAKSQKGQGMSMKEAIDRAWPAADTKLIEQAITDLQTSRERATDDISKLMRKAEGKFVEATLLSNISVTIKQAASYSTAGLYLSQKALFPYQATIAKLFAADNSAFAKKLFAEIDEHTPMHYMRRKGMSMEEAATIAQDNSKVVRWMDKKLPDVANPLKWIQNMDVATTAAIWLATKRQVELDGVKQSDPTYWSRVTELYEKVISETQPMYDSLHRPEVQKNTNEVLRGLMMFRTQPLQNAGILYDAAGELAQAKKNGYPEQIKAANRKFRMAVGSQVASLAVFATMTLLAYAVRNRLGRYRDDEEELTVVSIMKRVLGDMAVNGAQLIAPIGGGLIAGGIEKVITGSSYGGTLSIPTLDAINDWVSQMDRVRQDIVKLSEDEEADIVTDSVDFAMDTAGVLGIPAKNAFGILRGIVGNITDLTGHELSWATDKPDPSMAIVKACFENGHMEKGREVIDQVIQSKMDAGKEKKEARSAVRSSLTAYYKKLYLRAYKKKNEKEMKRIRMVIQGSRMYDDNAADVVAGWVKKWAEEEKKKEKAKKK